MKLLFDQNISFQTIRILSNHFPDSAQVRDMKLKNSTDLEIWRFASKNNFIIVTFDADFYDFSNLYDHPAKIVWLRTGNTKTLYIANLLIQKEDQINIFLENGEVSCLEIY